MRELGSSSGYKLSGNWFIKVFMVPGSFSKSLPVIALAAEEEDGGRLLLLLPRVQSGSELPSRRDGIRMANPCDGDHAREKLRHRGGGEGGGGRKAACERRGGGGWLAEEGARDPRWIPEGVSWREAEGAPDLSCRCCSWKRVGVFKSLPAPLPSPNALRFSSFLAGFCRS